MIVIPVPGIGDLRLEHLVLDYNGTLALDGKLVEGVKERIQSLAELLEIHVVTADTFGIARQQLEGYPVTLHILEPGSETSQKQAYAEALGLKATAAIGNGSNDAAMLEAVVLGICILGPEGASTKAALNSHLLIKNILEGLDLFLNPQRLKATLRA